MSSVCGQADIDGLGTDFYIRQGIGNTLSRLKGLKTVPNDLGIMDKTSKPSSPVMKPNPFCSLNQVTSPSSRTAYLRN